MDIGGQFMTHSIFHALLQVLLVPCVGLAWAICVVQVFYLVIVDGEYRSDLSGRVFGKQKL
jgi:hypothetical protein